MKAEWDVETEEVQDYNNLSYSIVTRKTLKINDKEVFFLSEEELQEARAFFFDRWNWDTGSPADREIFDALEAEANRREQSGRTLNATWTVEAQGDLDCAFGIDLENELAEALGKEILGEVIQDLKSEGKF